LIFNGFGIVTVAPRDMKVFFANRRLQLWFGRRRFRVWAVRHESVALPQGVGNAHLEKEHTNVCGNLWSTHVPSWFRRQYAQHDANGLLPPAAGS